jgi:hypothetical protein
MPSDFRFNVVGQLPSVTLTVGGNVTFDLCPFFQEHSQGIQQRMDVIQCKTDFCL